MRVGSPETEIACSALRSAGYGVLPSVREESCPYVVLPDIFDELWASRSRNARQQVRSRRRDLDLAGKVRFRTACDGSDVERDFDALFGSRRPAGKDERELPAIANHPGARSFYYGFYAGRPSAAGCGCICRTQRDPDRGEPGRCFGGEGFFLKTAFDESYAQLAQELWSWPRCCERLVRKVWGHGPAGRADQYKMRWTDRTRPRQRLRVYRGPVGRIAHGGWNGISAPQACRVAGPSTDGIRNCATSWARTAPVERRGHTAGGRPRPDHEARTCRRARQRRSNVASAR
jgi:hypothetical protein